MRIIKPYGRSHVEKEPTGQTRRVLRLRANREKRLDIEEFARSHDALVIAQWISTIDKIASKPSGRAGPTDEQRKFRERLGKAAWALLEAKGLLPGLKDAETKIHLAKIWKSKVHPYGTALYKPKRDKQGREFLPPSSKGRWYDRFAGEVDVKDVDAGEVARKIHEHLHVAEYRIGATGRNRQSGRIAARARSISGNVLCPGPIARAGATAVGWTAADRQAYARVGDVAREIRQAAEAREAGRDQARTKRVSSDIAGKALFGHYARLFRGNDGNALSIHDARERAPGLFNLHMAVKDCYSRILKHHNKDQKSHGDRRRKVSVLLPNTMDQLFALVDAKGANRDLNALIRQGKIVHYDSAVGGADSPADIVKNWPADVSASTFWTSDGQAMIKRNEAFVRVWRHVLALASRTLTDWADPDGRQSDILLDGPIGQTTGERFDRERYRRKLRLLYGNRAAIIESDDEAFEKGVLRLALKGIAGLRHGSFHFKGLGGFARALANSNPAADTNVLAAVGELWKSDVGGRAEQMRKTMQGAHFEYFLDEDQARALFDVLSRSEPAAIPLPRFTRMLRRAQNAWAKGEDELRLPGPANRLDLENPARLCQYTALKLVYERPFRNWLEKSEATVLNSFIDRAVNRATDAARIINAKNDEDRRELIVAKAAFLGRLADGDTVHSFFFNLSAETASEMRVQRGYDSDPDNAREQAGYIEELKCDVVALAFGHYLKDASFEFLLDVSEATPKPDTRLCDLDRMPLTDVETGAEDWQMVLYFLVHLVPVDEAGRLLHQMRKWEILAKDPEPADGTMTGEVRQVQSVLELYLDMHDAKFEGGATLAGIDDFAGLFDSRGSFDRVFPAQPGADDDRRIGKRGLREIMRFGHLPALRRVFEKHRIQAKEAEAFLRAEERSPGGPSEIARLQERRESLHEKWTREKRDFSGDDLRAYVEALAGVVRHRHLAAHVTLTDHARLHRLLMAVLGRLVDFSGLWERDLYFVTLAMIHQNGLRPGDVFTNEGLKFLGNGQIVDALRCALRNCQHGPEAHAVKDSLRRHFGPVWKPGNGNVKTRNEFAHFDMLKPSRSALDLTACVNDARDLMAYDRKLKNAVTQSIKELLRREGLDLDWTMGADHRLGAATLAPRQARHLGEIRLPERQGPRATARRPPPRHICENLHGDRFVAMAAALFDRAAAQTRESVVDMQLDRVDWHGRQPRKNRKESHRAARKKPEIRGGKREKSP